MAATVSSYKLEAPRPRPPPLPIRTNTTSRPPSRIAGSKDTARPLLYDLPSATPTSPQYPASPVSPTGRSHSRASRSRGMTPPPHERAPTPSRPLDRDLEKFAEVCKAWYVSDLSCSFDHHGQATHVIRLFFPGITTKMTMLAESSHKHWPPFPLPIGPPTLVCKHPYDRHTMPVLQRDATQSFRLTSQPPHQVVPSCQLLVRTLQGLLHRGSG